MIEEDEVHVGVSFRYPHPNGYGMVRTTVVEKIRPTRAFPNGRVRHEASRIGWRAVDTMEVFTANAERLIE